MTRRWSIADRALPAEAQAAVEEGIVEDADLADAGLIFGSGFALSGVDR